MAGPDTWLDRLPRWLTVPEVPSPSGSSMGPRERILLVLALVGIAIWGFTGSWEYATVETSVAVASDDDARAATPGGAAVAGAELFQANGCYACHSLDGERKIGPSLRGIFGATVELEDGSTILIDGTYLVESILQPEAKRVAGYDDAAMPSYEGLVSAEDASALAEYIKGLE
jgi:cytochrome c oxidase subunit 2